MIPGNMFVPVELLRPVLDEMQATGRSRASIRPWLGLSSSEREAGDMGYTGVRLVGFLDALAPVTGRLATDLPMLPWASRLGQAPPG